MNLQIPSPCTGVCTIDEQTQTCSGCYRNIDEITRWSRMDDDERLSILSALINRRRGKVEPAEDAPSKFPTAPENSTDP